jgi:hypothetical protein
VRTVGLTVTTTDEQDGIDTLSEFIGCIRVAEEENAFLTVAPTEMANELVSKYMNLAEFVRELSTLVEPPTDIECQQLINAIRANARALLIKQGLIIPTA